MKVWMETEKRSRHRPSWTGGVARSAGVVAQDIVLEQPPRLRGFGR